MKFKMNDKVITVKNDIDVIPGYRGIIVDIKDDSYKVRFDIGEFGWVTAQAINLQEPEPVVVFLVNNESIDTLEFLKADFVGVIEAGEVNVIKNKITGQMGTMLWDEVEEITGSPIPSDEKTEDDLEDVITDVFEDIFGSDEMKDASKKLRGLFGGLLDGNVKSKIKSSIDKVQPGVDNLFENLSEIAEQLADEISDELSDKAAIAKAKADEVIKKQKNNLLKIRLKSVLQEAGELGVCTDIFRTNIENKIKGL